MNHKRGRPKHQRAGCLYCKPYKDERESKESQRFRDGHQAPDSDEDDPTWAEIAREVDAHWTGEGFI